MNGARDLRLHYGWRLALSLAALMQPLSAAGDPWVEVRSPHTIVLSDAGKQVARRVAARFERFRAAISIIWPWARVDPPIPLLILAPRDEDGLKVLLPEYWEGKDRAHPAGVFIEAVSYTHLTLPTILRV